MEKYQIPEGKSLGNKLKDIEQILNSIKKSFKDRLYVEIQRHNESQENNLENFRTRVFILYNRPMSVANMETYFSFVKKDIAILTKHAFCTGAL